MVTKRQCFKCRTARVEEYVRLSTPTYSDYIVLMENEEDEISVVKASSIANETRKEYDARLKTWRQNKDK